MSTASTDLLTAQRIETDLSRLQQLVHATAIQQVPHLRMQAGLEPDTVGNESRDWLGIVNDLERQVGQLADEAARLGSRLPSAAPAAIRSHVLMLKRSIDGDLDRVRVRVKSARTVLLERMNSPDRTPTPDSISPGPVLDVVAHDLIMWLLAAWKDYRAFLSQRKG